MGSFHKGIALFPVLRFHHSGKGCICLKIKQIFDEWLDCVNQTQLPWMPRRHEMLEGAEYFAACGFIVTQSTNPISFTFQQILFKCINKINYHYYFYCNGGPTLLSHWSPIVYNILSTSWKVCCPSIQQETIGKECANSKLIVIRNITHGSLSAWTLQMRSESKMLMNYLDCTLKANTKHC